MQSHLYLLTSFYFTMAETQVARVKELWPFLFQQPWLGTHFQLLTGQIVDQALYSWRTTHAETTIMYLMSSSTAATEMIMIENTAEKIKWERAGKDSATQMLLVLKMLSNFFAEANGFKDFIITKEVGRARENDSEF